jgi:hypothetical protein
MSTTPTSTATIDDAIFGLDFMVVAPCGHRLESGHYCTCPKRRIDFHSIKSHKLILRCPWCRCRCGHPSETEIKRLRAFVAKYDFTARPIVLHENGDAYVI